MKWNSAAGEELSVPLNLVVGRRVRSVLGAPEPTSDRVLAPEEPELDCRHSLPADSVPELAADGAFERERVVTPDPPEASPELADSAPELAADLGFEREHVVTPEPPESSPELDFWREDETPAEVVKASFLSKNIN